MTTTENYSFVVEFEGTVPEIAFDVLAAHNYISSLVDTMDRLKKIERCRVLTSDEGHIFRFVYGPFSFVKVKTLQNDINEHLYCFQFHRFPIRPSIEKDDSVFLYWVGKDEINQARTPRRGLFSEEIRQKNDDEITKQVKALFQEIKEELNNEEEEEKPKGVKAIVQGIEVEISKEQKSIEQEKERERKKQVKELMQEIEEEMNKKGKPFAQENENRVKALVQNIEDKIDKHTRIFDIARLLKSVMHRSNKKGSSAHRLK